jgi:nucleoside-diphosphate-sugar epimerase
MSPASLTTLPTVDNLFYAVGYDSTAPASKRDVYVEGLGNVLTAMAGRCRRLVYVSSTSVYGQSEGEIVTETSPCEPRSEGGQISLDAESRVGQWRESAGLDSRAMILRLAGLYGPDRLLTRSDVLMSGKFLSGRGDAWLNLIHRDDAARLAIQCARHGHDGATYLGVDEEPVRRGTFYTHLARMLGAPAPSFDGNIEAAGRGSISGLNKRCENSWTREELEFRCEYPSFREGLEQAIDLPEADVSSPE